jgi:tetratricopeptide (TPR) repeat protein
MKKTLLTVVIGVLPLTATAQDPATLQRMFEAGQLREVAGAGTAEAAPAALYLAGLSHQKLGERDQALAAYGRLAASGNPVWQAIGASAQQLLQGQLDTALQRADAAVAAGGSVPEAHYQRGLVLANRQAWSEAAAAFDRAAELSPSMAYAHYNAGLAHYRANRPDQMAVRFEQFLKLAPKAPERPEVQQIMRTIRGR